MLLILLIILYLFDFIGVFNCAFERNELLAIRIGLPAMAPVTAQTRVILLSCTSKAVSRSHPLCIFPLKRERSHPASPLKRIGLV